MTVIVQNVAGQPMAYDEDTGKVIVDQNGYVLNGAASPIFNRLSPEGIISTAVSVSMGLVEAINYAGNSKKILVKHGNYTSAAELQFTDQFMEFEGGSLTVSNVAYALNFSYANGAKVKGNGTILWTKFAPDANLF